MCTKRHSSIKAIIISGLFILSAFNYAQAAPMLNSANGHYYELVNSRLTFDAAKKAAELKTYNGVAGHLVTITDATEQTFVQKFGLSQSGLYWIGGKIVSNVEQWITGETFSYTNWALTGPKVGDSGLSMGGSGYTYKWFGQTTTNTRDGYIVEYDTKLNQTISFSPTTTGTVGGTVNLTATATPRLTSIAITFASTTPTICTVSGNVVSFVGAGTCTVTADQAGNTAYNAATQVSANITVSKTNQTISFSPALTGTVGTTANLSATATSNLAVAFASTTPTICTVSGNVVSFVGAGTCTVTANQAGNTTYDGAQVSANITVSKGNQTISFSPALTGTVGTTANLSATATSNLAVTFASSPLTICTVSGTTLSFRGVGICVVTANQAGNANYNAANQVVANIEVSNPLKTNQTISFNAPSGKTFGDADFTISATATSNLPVSFIAMAVADSDSPASIHCSVTNSTVKILSAGYCGIRAVQIGDATYNAAMDVTQTFQISKANQTVIFTPTLTGTVGQSATLSATGGLSNNAIVFESSIPTICTVTGNNVSFASVGTCRIWATQAGNDNYNTATTSANIEVSNVSKTDQIIAFSPDLSAAIAGQSAILTATVDSGLTPITFTSYPVEICEVAGNNIVYKVEGICSIIVRQAGNGQFNPVEQKVDINVMSKDVFSLNFTDIDGNFTFQAVEGDILNINLTFQAATADVGKSALFYLKAVAGNTSLMLTRDGFVAATNPLQPVSSTPTVLTAESVALSIYSGVLPAGKYTIYAEYQTTDGNKQEATSVLTVKAKQILSFTNLPTMVTVGESRFVMLGRGDSNNPVILISTTTDICTVQGQTVSFIAEGSCVLSAQQNGNEFFADVQVTGEIRVGSAGVFSLNVTDRNNLPVFQAIEEDVLNISLTFKAPSADIGKSALFYLTAEYYPNNLGTILELTRYTYPSPSTPSVLSQESITVPLYSGAFLAANKFTITAWYVTTDGNIRRATSVINVLAKRYVDAYAVATARGKSVAYAMAYAAAIYLGKTEMYATTYALQYESQIISGKSVAYATTYATAYANSYTTAKAAGRSEFRATLSARSSAESYTSPFVPFVSRVQSIGNRLSLPHQPVVWLQ